MNSNILNSTVSRQCFMCKFSKPLTKQFFHANKNRPLGFEYKCKECEKKRLNKRRRNYSDYTPLQKQQKTAFTKAYANTEKGKAVFYRSVCKNMDKKKGYATELTLEFIILGFKSSCYYCGFLSTGLDRIDNTKGHTIANCVPACKECNIARMDNFTHEEMKIIGLAIKHVKEKRM